VEVGFWTSGITGAMMVADMAYGYEIPVAMMNCPGNFMAQVAAAMPNHMMMEWVAAGREACFTTDATVKDGWIVLGNAPGIGIVYDEEKLKFLASKGFTSEQRLFPGRRQGAGLYEVPYARPKAARRRS
jgi:L-alanine-DL-glutamate epimerase-like enolase superfamily enzyme